MRGAHLGGAALLDERLDDLPAEHSGGANDENGGRRGFHYESSVLVRESDRGSTGTWAQRSVRQRFVLFGSCSRLPVLALSLVFHRFALR
jgi:hypothetical protein